MNTVLRAFCLFVILLVLALLLGQAGTVPVPVSLQLGSLTLQTTAPVAITLTIAVLLLVFYLGRLVGWLVRLPKKFANHRKLSVAESLADAYTAWVMNDLPAATRPLVGLKPETPAHADLATLLALQTAAITPQQAQAYLENPRLAPLTALYLARLAAGQANWEEVLRVTTIGRKIAPSFPPLLILQFKSLLNINSPRAVELLPALKGQLSLEHHKLLTSIIQNPATPPARTVLEAPFTKAFQAWLPTPSDTFPTI